jgi:hypothetical protein
MVIAFLVKPYRQFVVSELEELVEMGEEIWAEVVEVREMLQGLEEPKKSQGKEEVAAAPVY